MSDETAEERRRRGREAMRRWRAKNRDKERARKRERRRNDPEYLARVREQDRLAKQRERQADPEKHRRELREWARRNPDKIKRYSAKQLARIKADPILLENVRKRGRVGNMSRERVLAERKRKRLLAAANREKSGALLGCRRIP